GGVRPGPAPPRLPPPVPPALGRRTVQAPAPLPAVDGPARAAGLRAVDLGVAGPAADPRGHPRGEHEPGHRPDAAPHAHLAHGGGDHRPAAAARPGRPGEVRLRPLPHADVRRVPGPPRPRRLSALRPAGRLPALARTAWLTWRRRWPPS